VSTLVGPPLWVSWVQKWRCHRGFSKGKKGEGLGENTVGGKHKTSVKKGGNPENGEMGGEKKIRRFKKRNVTLGSHMRQFKGNCNLQVIRFK